MELASDDGADDGAGVAPVSTRVVIGVVGTIAAGLEVAPADPGGKAPPPPPQVEALAAPVPAGVNIPQARTQCRRRYPKFDREQVPYVIANTPTTISISAQGLVCL